MPVKSGRCGRCRGHNADAFVKVSRSLTGFCGESSLSTWIHRIATNVAMDHLRKHAFRQTANMPDRDDVTFDNDYTISDHDTPINDALLIRKDMNECIRVIVDSLPDNYRTPEKQVDAGCGTALASAKGTGCG